MVYVIWCMVYYVCCMVYVVCCMLYVVCCMLYVVWFTVHGVWCMLYGVCDCRSGDPAPMTRGYKMQIFANSKMAAAILEFAKNLHFWVMYGSTVGHIWVIHIRVIYLSYTGHM